MKEKDKRTEIGRDSLQTTMHVYICKEERKITIG